MQQLYISISRKSAHIPGETKPLIMWLLMIFFSQLLLASATLSIQCDYVVVGAGTTGLALANRLSADPRIRVALVDPGGDERQNAVVKDVMNWINVADTYVNWNYSSVPQENANDRSIGYSAGKGIGGTSLMNGMTYIRGDKAQFDAWEMLGNPGWNWESLFKRYIQDEQFYPPSPGQLAAGATFEDKNHGISGELHVGFNPLLDNSSFYQNAADSWKALGQAVRADVNGGNTRGFSVWPQTLDPLKNVRWDAATAFYWPIAKKRSNVQLVNGTVSKIVWNRSCSNPRATGVEYINPQGQHFILEAKKEVILSAGALRSPLILERSGVGNRKRLEKLGIKTLVDLPSVGENMIDQPNVPLVYASTTKFDGYTPYATFPTAKDLFGTKFDSIAASTKEHLRDWAMQLATESHGGLNAKALHKVFELQHKLMFGKRATVAEILSLASDTVLVSALWPLLPFSRGSVHLRSVRESDINAPVINPNFFRLEFDIDINVATAKMARKFWETMPVSDLVKGPLQPNAPANASDEDWKKYLRSTIASNSHALGTAAMMSKDLGGAVGPDLKVYGVENVRVADASIMPTQFSGHLTATLYAIADKAADMILTNN